MLAGGHLFVSSRNDNTLVVLDPKTLKPAGEPIDVGFNPYALAADERSVWVTGLGDNTLTRIDFTAEEFRCARCGASAARATHAAHGPEVRIASGRPRLGLHHIVGPTILQRTRTAASAARLTRVSSRDARSTDSVSDGVERDAQLAAISRLDAAPRRQSTSSSRRCAGVTYGSSSPAPARCVGRLGAGRSRSPTASVLAPTCRCRPPPAAGARARARR